MHRNDGLIKKKIYRYMMTGIMTTIALQLGNVVDAMIVGNLLGSLANGAVTAATPYLYVLQAAAILLGSGGAVSEAVLLGRRDTENSGRVMGLCILASIVYPLFFTVIYPISVPAFVRMSGTTGELAEMLRSITTVYSIGMPVISFVITMAYLINVDNNPTLSANMHITANAVNLVLDYLLVRFTPLGITGAALSTVLGYLVAGMIFIPQYFKSDNRMVRPVLSGLIRTRDNIYLTCKNGFPNLAYLIMTVISVCIINKNVLNYLGSGYFSAYAVANNTQLIVQMFLNGISSVIASVAGVLYGEKDYYGMRRVLQRVLKVALLTGGLITLVFIAVPQFIGGLYGFDNDALRPQLYLGLRIFALSFCFFVLNAISQNYYRTIGHTLLSTASSAMELIVIKLPLMLAGMLRFGFAGLFGAIIFSELLSFVFLNVVRLSLQKMGRLPGEGYMMIPAHSDGQICDMTIRGSDEEAVNVSKQVIEFCLAENMDRDQANALGIAAEELIANIGRYGYADSKDKYIDVCLSRTGDIIYLRLRDDGIPFDPVSYEPPEHEEFEMGGLELIKRMAVKINYMRVINLNNTVIEVPLKKRGAHDE
ncbi:MAG: ATP-binding protein [Lachnospiraceae bacterium]|nr:ATP-binding protein [Lachnospiraceae bacterium]